MGAPVASAAGALQSYPHERCDAPAPWQWRGATV